MRMKAPTTKLPDTNIGFGLVERTLKCNRNGYKIQKFHINLRSASHICQLFIRKRSFAYLKAIEIAKTGN